MTTEISNPNDDGTPSNDQQLTPPSNEQNSQSYTNFNESQANSTPNINQKDLRQHYASQSYNETGPFLPNNEKQCYVCGKKFGVRRMRRKHTCRRCSHKVCGSCSSKKRYDNSSGTMVRVCDKCILCEHCIVMTHRLRNLKLKHNKRNGGTYIVKVSSNSKEYYEGLINKCKIIEINEQNVESLNAQLIADKLNTIKIPFSITLDYTQAEIKHDQLKNLKNRKHKLNLKNSKEIINENNSKKKEISNENSKEIIVNQHSQNAYYYNNNQQQQYQPPVIVTGPSNDIRNIYKPNVLSSYSDSYNEGYYEHRDNDMEHQGVIYEESSPRKRGQNNIDADDDTGEEVSTSDGDDDSDTDDDDDDTFDNANNNNNNKENTPSLMQYESDPTNKEENDSDNRPPNIRAKSVPVTPILNGKSSTNTNININNIISTTPTLKGNIQITTPFVDDVIKSITLDTHNQIDNITSKTPKGNKSSNNVLEIQERKKRSLSQDNLDPTSPPLMGTTTIETDNKLLETPTKNNNQNKKPIFKRKKGGKKLKKKKKKKDKNKQIQFENDIKSTNHKKNKFFRKKKHVENYTNLHNNIYGLENDTKPVINSNIQNYTTQSLNPPNYSIIDTVSKRRQSKTQNMGSLQAKQHQLRHSQYAQQNVARQRLEMQQHIAQSNHVLVNPYRQYSIAFNKRPFNIKLQFRNGFNAFTSPSPIHIQQSHTLTRPEYIWGWYSVSKHPKIPIGSKLISINFEWIYGKNQQDITQLMYNSPLPTTLIFEAPSYLNHIPPSIYIELNDIKSDENNHENIINNNDKSFSFGNYLQNNKSIIYWWLEEGGFIVILLALLGLFVLDMPLYTQFKYYLPTITAFVTVLLMSIPPKQLFNLLWNIMHTLLFSMNRRTKGSGLKIFGQQLLNGTGIEITDFDKKYISISDDQTLLNPYILSSNNNYKQEQMSSRKSMPHLNQHQIQQIKHHKKMKKHKKKMKKEDKDLDEKKYENDNNSSQSERDIKDDEKEDDINDSTMVEEDSYDSNWETNICFPGGSSKIWGSFKPCTAKTLKLRGGTYLNDKIKIASEESLLSLANMDIFTVHHKIHHMAQNEVSWFYQNRHKLPKSLFFIIFHLRLDSMTASVVQYFYIDKNKFKHLLQTNDKVKQQSHEKGDGYFAIGGSGFDESGMFWNFINGPCNYRNDRLKLLARKEEGPWYMQIPSRPAIIGRQVPIEYMRGYNANHLNSIKIHNTNSKAYEPYEFKTLYHDPKIKQPTNEYPCDCGKCHWINTNGEYPEYIEVDICCEVNSLAKNTIRVACPLAKSLMVEMHWTMEGQINNHELPERMLASARLIHVDLTKLVEVD